VEVTVPLATVQGLARSAGENRLLGPLDPALTRDLAAAAARSPYSRWSVTVVDEHGYAVGHGVARARSAATGQERPRGPSWPRGPARVPTPTPTLASQGLHVLPARVNIIITQTRLRELATQAAEIGGAQPPARLAPNAVAPPGDWSFFLRGPTWTLILPGGRELAVRFDLVPTHDCDHRYQSGSYQPGDRLRRLVQIRDHECTFPTCSRAAKESDFEHAIPFDQGGRTDACNSGARSRRCHQVKQAPGWTVTQPRPGWHVWKTPTGRSYVQEPWRYTA
jgi:hypothetical protein